MFRICQEKKKNVVYRSVNSGLGIWLVYKSHRKVILSRITVYKVVYDNSGISALYKNSSIKSYSNFFFPVMPTTFSPECYVGILMASMDDLVLQEDPGGNGYDFYNHQPIEPSLQG